MKENERRTNAEEDPRTDEPMDAKAMQKRWGVSNEQIKDAIAHVGNNRSDIEEYLVNKKWQQG